jgi:hypothetical protein
MPRPSVEAEQPAMPVTPAETIVPYTDFLERRTRRYGVASELARQDVKASEG